MATCKDCMKFESKTGINLFNGINHPALTLLREAYLPIICDIEDNYLFNWHFKLNCNVVICRWQSVVMGVMEGCIFIIMNWNYYFHQIWSRSSINVNVRPQLNAGDVTARNYYASLWRHNRAYEQWPIVVHVGLLWVGVWLSVIRLSVITSSIPFTCLPVYSWNNIVTRENNFP